MATFGWSYKSSVSGVKRPKESHRKVEDWQKDREDVKIPLHSQTHSAESVNAGMKRRRYHPRAKIYVGNLNKDTKPVTLAEYFSFFGEIAYLKLVKDHDTGMSRGFAFITFVEVEKGEKAVRWCRNNHPRVDDKEIKVGFAERRQRPATKTQQHIIQDGNTNQKERRETHTLYWEYKWTQDPDSEVYGPYETGLMLQWYKMGYFSQSGCWVRQAQRIIAGHEQNVQRVQDGETNQNNKPILASLVDSYSSSSEDEESPTKRTKTHSQSQQVDNISDEDEKQDEQQDEKGEGGKWKSEKQEENNEMGRDNVINEASEHDEQNQQNNQQDESIKDKQTSGREEKTLSNEITEDINKNNDSENEDCETVANPTSSWYQAERGGYKSRDIFGRDSSSEDEDFDYNDLDQQLMQNEFVPISEIDFSMFP